MLEPPTRRLDRRVDILLVCDQGGHFSEMMALRPAWEPFSRAWVTVDDVGSRSVLGRERVVYAHAPTRRSVKNLARNGLLAWHLIRRLRPKVVLTTGAALAVPFAWVGYLSGACVVHVECSGRIGISLSGRLVSPVACRTYVQWPELVPRVRRGRYAGNLLLPFA
jgi:beta-1,4-N-acetylglucosaminyltransferase